MDEAEWLAFTDARETLGRNDCPEVSERKLRLFAIACCRTSRQLLLNKDHCDDLEVGARYADGQASVEELAAAYERSNGRACGMYYSSETEREIRRWAEATAVAGATALAADAGDVVWNIRRAAHRDADRRLSDLLREVVGNPFRPVSLDPSLRSLLVLSLAQSAYDEGIMPAGTLNNDRLAVLADALEDAGCTSAAILEHLRGQGPHVRGCWCVDLILNRK